MAVLSPEQRWQYKLSLNLKVRSSYGTQFQDFFSTVMEKAHGTDFVRVRPFGSLGDKGCDGYLQSKGQVFQCYGKLEDATINVAKIVAKLESDYALACNHLETILREWHFGHNLVSGLPTEVVLKIEAMRKDFPHHQFGLIGPEALEIYVFQLSIYDLYELLGPAATAQDSRNLQMEDVQVLIDTLISKIDDGPAPVEEIKPVPREKLIFNNLPQHWIHLISQGLQNAPYVKHYIGQNHDPEIGEKLATIFNERYKSLKLQKIQPGEIMDQLYEHITGIGSVTAQRQVAAHALLAHLFESCDIFEDAPNKVNI
ncbi:ABC-three component system protein [Vampirovibrio sp.]|uniref:ABC-three component system protein n=1 Tax=Vampirovibrio sp. TaxID=2717857 RepID=UPI00359357F6